MAGATNKCPRQDSESDADSPLLLHTVDEVMKQANKIGQLRDQLLLSLGNAKGEAKDNLRSAISGFFDGYMVLTNSFLYKLGQEDALESVKRSISAVQSSAPMVSYASVAARSEPKRSIFPDRVALDNCKPIQISTAKRILVGPRDIVKNNFKSAKDTKEAFLKSVNPLEVKLKANRIHYTAHNTIVLEADNVDVESLSSCAALAEADLEIKDDIKLNPRIIIHDIPVEYTEEDILRSVVELNLPGYSQDDVKIVSLYPAREKKLRSCIVEVKPECRRALERVSRIYIKWVSCRFADHIGVLQCFRCLKYGHKAKDCEDAVCCSECAGQHARDQCRSKNKLRCINCTAAGRESVAHSALDKSKCPMLRSKIERKSRRIDYGCK